MINWIKKTVIKLADRVTAIHDPFDDFTRPIIRRTTDSMATKAALFEAQMKSDFLLSSGVYTYKKPRPGEALDLGDQALWHGVYTAMWAAKYKVTQDGGDLQTLRASLNGMSQHYRNRKLIRGVDPTDGRIQDDVSNDQLSGHLAGLYFAWRYGDANTQANAADIMNTLIEELVANSMGLVNQDGTPTTYGLLIDTWKTDPLRLSLAIAVLSIANKMGNAAVMPYRIQLLKKYGEIIGFPKVKFLWWEQQYDTHRAALHLKMIMETSDEPWLKERCAWGLDRIWQMERKAQDPWVAALCAYGIAADELKRVAQRLHEYEVVERGQEVERINTTKEAYWNEHGVRFLVWNNNWRASQPLPFWMIGSQDFFPSRDLFSVDNWQGETDQSLRYNGGDFLASYWFMRAAGAVGADE